jgi:hypothetical protein
MRLFGQKVLLLVAVSTIGCRDANGPFESQQFVLQDINGRSLPTYLSATPGATPTIVSGSLTLSNDGQAMIAEHRIEWDGTERDAQTSYTYKIDGDKIVFDFGTPCPPNALCAAPPVGTVTPSGLSVDWAPFDPGLIVYHYVFLRST